MRVILGAYSFAHPGGTESYLFTVARELERLGHRAVVAAQERGPFAEFAERHGIAVPTDPADWPRECDAVFAHDAISAAVLAERYPDTRLVFFAHSPVHDHQLPVLVPGVVATVVVASELVSQRIEALNLGVPIVRLRHPIDTERFNARPIRPSPRHALVLSNYTSGARRQALFDAWESAGVCCTQVGVMTERELDVVPAIAEADIIVAKGRAALEGMSCGRAVYVYDDFGGDGWVTPENYAAFEANNFAGLATGEPRSPQALLHDLTQYSSDMGWLNRELVLAHHSARRHAIELLKVLEDPSRPRVHDAGALSEVARVTRAGWFAERRTMTLERELATLRERLFALEAAHEDARGEAERWQARALAAERELAEARSLLNTRRAQVGLAVGSRLDRLRGRA